MPNKKSKRIDFIVIVLLVCLGYGYSRLTANLFIGQAVFGGTVFLVPSVIYLGWRSPKPWKKIIIGALVFGCLFGFFFEFFQEVNKTYIFPHTAFPNFLPLVPLDKVIGHFEMALLTFTYYEHFIDKSRSHRISKRTTFGVLSGLAVTVLLLDLYYFYPTSLHGRYPYLYSGLLAITPLFIYIYHHPKSLRDLVDLVPFFFCLYFLMEMSALQNEWWVFTGNNYIGSVKVFNLGFPVEDLIFWMFFYAATVTSYYKIFIERAPSRRLIYKKA